MAGEYKCIKATITDTLIIAIKAGYPQNSVRTTDCAISALMFYLANHYLDIQLVDNLQFMIIYYEKQTFRSSKSASRSSFSQMTYMKF